MKSMKQLAAAAGAQVPVSDYVPFSAHVADNVIRLRNGELLAIWKLEGVAFETADPEQVGAWKESLVNFLRALGGGQWALWSHKIRRPFKDRLDGQFPAPFCAEFARAYEDRLGDSGMMVTELYLSVIHRPDTSRLAKVFSLGRPTKAAAKLRAQIGAHIDAINDLGAQLESSLARYAPMRLATVERAGATYSEMLAVLGFLLNGVWEEVPLKATGISEYLPSSRLFFGDGNGMLEYWHAGGKGYAGFIDMQEYPAVSQPGMNNALLYGNYPFIETQSFSILSKRDALAALRRQQGHLEAAADSAQSEIVAMNEAIDQVASGQVEIGEYHYTLCAFGRTLDEVAQHLGDARTSLQDGPGFKMALIDAIPECAWFAQLPGNWGMRPREANITSRNFACLSPFHNFPQGKRDGNPWGTALAMMATPSRQPFYFNFHASPDEEDATAQKYPGNTFICGSTGSGKTTIAMALVAFATRVPGFRAVVFDKDRGMEIGLRAMGGRYLPLRRGEPTGFNPLQLEATEENIAFCEELIRLLVKRSPGEVLTARDEAAISQAVRTVMSANVAPELRRLGLVAQSLPVSGDDALRERLRRWTAGEPLGWVFDNATDLIRFDQASLFGFDYTEFLDDPTIRTPVVAYLLHRTESLITGEPFMFYMTEFWKPLEDEFFTGFARDKLKTIRKQSGIGLFDTQSPSDVLINGRTGQPHPVGRTVVEQCSTKIYLPNPSADRGDYVGGFKLTEAEFEILRALDEGSRMALIKQGQRSAVVRFDLTGMTQILDVISGSQDNVELLDQVRGECGDDPTNWLPVFHQRVAARRARAKRVVRA